MLQAFPSDSQDPLFSRSSPCRATPMSAHQNSSCQSPYFPVSSGVQFSTNRPRCANQASANSTLTIVIFDVQILEFSLVFGYAVTTSLGRMVCGNLHTRVSLSSSIHSGEDVLTSLAIFVSIWGPNHGCLSPMQVTWSPPTRVDNCISVNAPSGSHRCRSKQ
jgi:hypothetical protein